jgi:hypothetical protein
MKHPHGPALTNAYRHFALHGAYFSFLD